MCSVTGTTEKMHMAANMIQELVQNALVHTLFTYFYLGPFAHKVRQRYESP